MALGSELGEARRNQLLRRVDWRFLLPNPRPPKTLCLADGELREAVGLISGQVADDRTDDRTMDDADAELAVAVEPDHAALRRAWAGLAPGGLCYTEWHAIGSPGPAGIRRRLHAAGFERVRCYTPWSSPARCQLWLPLDAPGVRRFLRNRPFPFRDPIRRLRGRGARIIASIACRLGARRPICAVARRADASGAGGPTSFSPSPPLGANLGAGGRHEPLFFETIRTEWAAWGIGAGPPRLAWALATGGRESISKVVGLVFTEGSSQPSLVVKMARVPESIAGLTREAAALRALAGLRPGGVSGVPRFLFQTCGTDTTAVGETALLGTPLSGLLRRSTYRHLAMAATDWLARLACDTRAPASVHQQRIEPVLAEFGECFAPIVDADQVRATRDIVAPLEALPAICEQRDFSPWNVFVTPERTLAVLDWESSDLAGLPALDLVYFLTFLALSANGLGHAPRSAAEAVRFLHSYREGTDPETSIGEVHQECLGLYCQRVGLETGLLHALRLFTWMLHARSEYRRFVADHCGRPTPEALSRSVFVRLWMEELRHGGR
jgi:hypothetical protein